MSDYYEMLERTGYENGLRAGRAESAKLIAAAEERGRRSGVEERDELRMALAALAERAGGLLRLTKGEMEAVDRRAVLETVPQIGGGLLVRVLAPRDSGKETAADAMDAAMEAWEDVTIEEET